MNARIREHLMVHSLASKIALVSIGILSLVFALVSCSGSGGGEEENTMTSNFPPVVFSADKDSDGTVELYASFSDGTEIIKLSGTMVAGGNVVDFKVSPDGIYVAYVADQDLQLVKRDPKSPRRFQGSFAFF